MYIFLSIQLWKFPNLFLLKLCVFGAKSVLCEISCVVGEVICV
jgi:hypothetical protein